MAIIPANMTPHGLVELYHSDQECILEVPTRDTLDVNSVEDEVLKIHVPAESHCCYGVRPRKILQVVVQLF